MPRSLRVEEEKGKLREKREGTADRTCSQILLVLELHMFSDIYLHFKHLLGRGTENSY